MPIWPKAQRIPEEQIQRNSDPTRLNSDCVQHLKKAGGGGELKGIKGN